MAKYLVTGGAGFIGSHLCDALIEEHDVYVYDNLLTGSLDNLPAGIHLIQADICDAVLLQEVMAEMDGCFHLAAVVSIPQCNENLLAAHHVNLTGTLNVIESAHALMNKNKIVPVVFASTCAVYGNSTDFPLSESGVTQPISIYAALKLCGEQYGRFANELFKVPFTAIRLFNVYGVRQALDSQYSGVIPIFFNKLLHDEPLIFYGDGQQTRDFICVKDVVALFIKCMNSSTNTSRIYNACTGECASVAEVAQILSNILDKKLEVELKPGKQGDIRASLGNIDLAARELNFTAQYSIETGLKEYVRILMRNSG